MIRGTAAVASAKGKGYLHWPLSKLCDIDSLNIKQVHEDLPVCFGSKASTDRASDQFPLDDLDHSGHIYS